MPYRLLPRECAVETDTGFPLHSDRPGRRNRTPRLSTRTTRDGMLVLLAIAAGCVDAVSYLGLGEVLTAAMTGNTILLGLAIGQAKVPAALRSCAALVGFVFGAVVAAAISERGAKDAIWPRAVTVRSEEHTSELQSLMRISYDVF